MYNTWTTEAFPELAARRAVRECAERFYCEVVPEAPGFARIRAEGVNAEFIHLVAASFAAGRFQQDRADFEL